MALYHLLFLGCLLFVVRCPSFQVSDLWLRVTAHLELFDNVSVLVNLLQPEIDADGQLPFDKERLCSIQKHLR
jgi:hypothetical protein